MEDENGKAVMLQNEWPKIATNFHKPEVISCYTSVLARIVGEPGLFDAVKNNPLLYKLHSGDMTLTSVLGASER